MPFQLELSIVWSSHRLPILALGTIRTTKRCFNRTYLTHEGRSSEGTSCHPSEDTCLSDGPSSVGYA